MKSVLSEYIESVKLSDIDTNLISDNNTTHKKVFSVELTDQQNQKIFLFSLKVFPSSIFIRILRAVQKSKH